MTWTAPDASRTDPPYISSERAMLETFLDWHRDTLRWKCAGLTADQLRRRSIEPSTLSLLGLVRHLAEVERSWFRRRLDGQELAFLYSSDERPNADFDDVDTADAEEDFRRYDEEVALAREAASRHELDDTFFHAREKTQISLRWVYAHMIEEYARHNGHADLLRQRIDGATGE